MEFGFRLINGPVRMWPEAPTGFDNESNGIVDDVNLPVRLP